MEMSTKKDENGEIPVNVKLDIQNKSVPTLLKMIEQMQGQLDAERTQKEDYRNKLTLVAEQMLNKKKRELVKKFPKFESEILEKGIDGLKILEHELKTSTSQDEAENLANPKGESGTAPLSGNLSNNDEGYDSYEAMIRDIREKSHSDDKKLAKEADELLNEFYKRWLSVRKNRQVSDFEYRGSEGIKKMLEQKNQEEREKRLERLKEKGKSK